MFLACSLLAVIALINGKWLWFWLLVAVVAAYLLLALVLESVTGGKA